MWRGIATGVDILHRIFLIAIPAGDVFNNDERKIIPFPLSISSRRWISSLPGLR